MLPSVPLTGNAQLDHWLTLIVGIIFAVIIIEILWDTRTARKSAASRNPSIREEGRNHLIAVVATGLALGFFGLTFWQNGLLKQGVQWAIDNIIKIPTGG